MKENLGAHHIIIIKYFFKLLALLALSFSKFTTSFKAKENIVRRPSQPLMQFNGVYEVPNVNWARVGTTAKTSHFVRKSVPGRGTYVSWDDDANPLLRMRPRATKDIVVLNTNDFVPAAISLFCFFSILFHLILFLF